MNTNEEEKFSDDPEENFRMENDFIKLKLKAQYGDSFQMFGGDASLPPEIENQFLKNMILFEENYQKADYITLFEKLGNPKFIPLEDFTAGDLIKEYEKLIKLLEKNKIFVDFIYEDEYALEVKYKFITEELINEEVDRNLPNEMNTYFTYESFHPNHNRDLNKEGQAFLAAWLSGNLIEVEQSLSDEIVTEKRKQIPKADIVKKIKNRFDAFERFENDGFNIYDVSHQIFDDTNTAMGHVEGDCKVDGVLENGEKVHFEGGYKIYFTFEHGFWEVVYFILPGFNWEA